MACLLIEARRASSVSLVPSTSRLRVKLTWAIRVPSCPPALISSRTRASNRRTALLRRRPTLACRHAVPDFLVFKRRDILIRSLHGSAVLAHLQEGAHTSRAEPRPGSGSRLDTASLASVHIDLFLPDRGRIDEAKAGDGRADHRIAEGARGEAMR